VVVTGPTPLFSAEGGGGRQLCFYKDENKIATIRPGDDLSVRRIIYEKDYMTVRVQLKSGQEGYLVSGGKWRLQ
jgi:hypothetical protein